jgi:hypothetical protein
LIIIGKLENRGANDIDKAKNTFRRLLSQFQVIDEYKEKLND